MKRIAALSGVFAMSALALGTLAAPAHADNNAKVQNITIPICIDLLEITGLDEDGCTVLHYNTETGVGHF
ncbi:hypothetical protein [Marinitenerispora sediminis]|uniref:Uncharacterized protein n=1 Tax=Marinitenerispora sediminis TaxID=1931232 RepID=A0A368TAF6_9ACTN|nr:hypothetical protein [Marinitenerispora sediminis]RCV52866.1 hypothetical protein DEF28_11970 [Marinitenerispora sediminis]RCV60042.1 hypothetical protein DEF23_05765 [Marinitenerispora sediminis]RCV61949.1 hypothetical protein DEF24_03070 [Marinitenerispora sediminis]